MNEQMKKDLPNWEKEYLKDNKSKLTEQEIELLQGRDIKSHEGMIFGSMYADWKLRKGYQ